MKRLLKIAVLGGGPSSEHQVSLNSAAMVLKYLDRKKYTPTPIVIKKSGTWKFGSKRGIDIGPALERLKAFDFVFVALHGAFGEDGRVQALLEWIGKSYSGSDVLSSAMAMDKSISNNLYKAIGLPVPHFMLIKRDSKSKVPRVKVPVVVKPAGGGSSVGISILRSEAGLSAALKKAFKEDDQVIIQKYISGREFTCGILEDKRGQAFALPPTEIVPKTSTFFDYKAKYKIGGSLEITPARLSKAMTKNIQAMALKAHASLGCSGMSRSDFILKGSKFYILETNTIPGMTQASLLPQAAKAMGVGFTDMLDLIIASGLRKTNS